MGNQRKTVLDGMPNTLLNLLLLLLETATQYLVKIWHVQTALRNKMMGKDQVNGKGKKCMGNTSEK